MAQPTNAYIREDFDHAMEDLRDIIYDVSPEEVPFLTNANKGTADNTLHEWTEDQLDDPADPGDASATSPGNAFEDGDVFAPAAITKPTRLGNECQIQRKDFSITRRARKINKAGPNDEVARQVARKGRELKRDMEVTLLANQAKRKDEAGGAANAPLLAGLPTWISTTSATLRGATGSDATLDGTDIKGDGTKRALSESGLLTAVQEIYEDSQELPNVLLLDVKSKSNFSTYMFSSSARIATQYQNQGATPRGGVQVVGAVDVWVTDYAVLDVVPDRFNPLRNGADFTVNAAGGFDAFIYNTDWCDCVYFDPISTDVIGKRSDTDERMVLVDHTLVVRARDTVSTFADIDETLAMVA